MDAPVRKLASLISYKELEKLMEERPRGWVAGLEVLNSGNLRFVGITKNTKERVDVVAFCIQSSDISNFLRIDFALTIKGKKRDVTCECSCIGGELGTCKHCSGLLMYLAGTDKKNIEEATCTDITQAWGTLKKDSQKMYEAVPISQFCHGKPDTTIRIQYPTKEQSQKYLGAILRCAPKSEIRRHREKVRSRFVPNPVATPSAVLTQQDYQSILQNPIYPPIHDGTPLYVQQNKKGLFETVCFRDLPKCDREYYLKHVSVTTEKAVDISKKTISQSGNDEWHRERRKRVPSSMAYGYITPWGNKNSTVDWNKRIQEHLNPSFSGNASTRHGTRMEPIARAWYMRTTGNAVLLSGLLVNPSIPWLGSIPDGLVMSEKRLIEIKCSYKYKDLPVLEMAKRLHWIRSNGENFELKEKSQYYCQVQLGLFISNLKTCDVIIYSPKDENGIIIPVTYNKKLVIEDYLPKLQAIYFKGILSALSKTEVK